MSKNKRISRRRQALISRLAQGEEFITVLKKLHITPGRALQMLASQDAVIYCLQYGTIAGMQEALIFSSSLAPASLTLRSHLSDTNASPELRLKAANAILAQRPKPAPEKNRSHDDDDDD